MMSSYEKKIYKILKKENIFFIQEKQINDFRNGKMRFDFWIPSKNCVIEINGEQHYKFNSKFYKTNSDFTRAQERDRQKISYCLANNIKIYCIPYWDIDIISSSKDLFLNKYIAKSKFHNDEIFRKKEKTD